MEHVIFDAVGIGLVVGQFLYIARLKGELAVEREQHALDHEHGHLHTDHEAEAA